MGGRFAEGAAAYGRPAFPGRVLLSLGGVNGRNPPRFPFCIEEEELGLRGACILPGAGRVLLLLGGVNGRNPPGLPLLPGEDGPVLRCVGMFTGPDGRVLLFGGVNGRNPP